MQSSLAVIALVFGLTSPPAAVQRLSGDLLDNAENALPEGVPTDGRIVQTRRHAREMARDARPGVCDDAPGVRRAIGRALGCSQFGPFGIKRFLAGATTAKGNVVNGRVCPVTEPGLAAALPVRGRSSARTPI